MRNVAVGWAGGKLAQDIEVAGHRVRSDEEVEKGGEDTGATPHELLLAALGSCTAMTLKAYAARKGWPLEDVMSVGAITLLYWLLRHGAAANVARLFYLVPPVTALQAWILFGETLDALALAGMVLIAVGVVLARRQV